MYLEPITEQNRAEALTLHVAKGQEGFVEGVAECLKEASEYDAWRPVALYTEGQMVGFAMYGFFPLYLPAGRVWMDRLLIDERFQHRGYGRAAMQLLLKKLRAEYGNQPVYLSVVPGNEKAEKLYFSLGFQRLEEKDVHGETVMVHP